MYKKIIIPILGIGLVALVAVLTLSNTHQNTHTIETAEKSFEPIIVLELFTSQGCSSCPPADALLEKAKKQYPKQVFALSYHVDYWNYIGWEDPFSTSQFTKKQSAYNRKFNYRGNYTPEMVINGKEHFVGSNASKLNAKINQYKKEKVQNEITILNVIKADDAISFNYTIDGPTSELLLHAVLVLDQRTTSVKRGENRNRTLTNSNIVVAEKYLLLPSKSNSGHIGIPTVVNSEDDLTLILLTEKENMTITGAVKQKI